MKIDLTKEEWEFICRMCFFLDQQDMAKPWLSPSKCAKLLEKLGSKWCEDEHKIN